MLEVRSDSIRLTAIEKIRAGDKVISTNADTFETEEKTVLETYIRWTDKLIHLVINGEELITTETHPFYVKERGFVNAGKLLIGDPLLDVHGNILVVENTRIEYLDEPETVYNFQVEDFHTYYVGTKCIFVHNANCKLIDNGDDKYDVELSYKKDWTTEQRFEADMKCKALSEADTYKTMPNRRWSASSRYKAAYGEDSVLPTQDVDHIIDLQLAGKDVITNMSPLDMSVNRSLGRQSAHVIKDLEPNTVLKNFRMK